MMITSHNGLKFFLFLPFKKKRGGFECVCGLKTKLETPLYSSCAMLRAASLFLRDPLTMGYGFYGLGVSYGLWVLDK